MYRHFDREGVLGASGGTERHVQLLGLRPPPLSTEGIKSPALSLFIRDPVDMTPGPPIFLWSYVKVTAFFSSILDSWITQKEENFSWVCIYLLISVQTRRLGGDELVPTPRRTGALWCPTPRGNTKVLVWSQQCIDRAFALFIIEGHSDWTYHCWPSFNSFTRILFYFIKSA